MSKERIIKSTFLVFVHYGELNETSPRLSKLCGLFDSYEAAVEFRKKQLERLDENSDREISRRLHNGAAVTYTIHEVESDVNSGCVVYISV